MYGALDLERWVGEPNKSVQRTEFARDRARIMHSSALRRLGVKTQVLVAAQDDFPRTRLTHSLEVAQVGRELGFALGCDPDLVDTACLAHDLGHPPFGHNGESALNELASDIGGFEGNAQSFRLLTRLEPKAISPTNGPRPNSSIGLNLTRASLDASLKYPWTRETKSSKFGVYADDEDVFQWVRNGRNDQKVSFEAQVMDWSDDVAYCVHDVEDAIHEGHVDVRILDSKTGRAEVVSIAQEWYGHEFDANALDEALHRLNQLVIWPKAYDGTLQSQAALKNLTSHLIGRFCIAAQKLTQDNYGQAPLTRYDADLIIPPESRYEVTALKALAARFVMSRAGVDVQYNRQRQLIADLFEVIQKNSPENLDAIYLELWNAADSQSAKKRVIIDQIASLTDVSLAQWHFNLCN